MATRGLGGARSFFALRAEAARDEDQPQMGANSLLSWRTGTGTAGGANYLLQGQVDDVRIYGRALSGAEVETLYRRQASRA